jgi:hypothetical protein
MVHILPESAFTAKARRSQNGPNADDRHSGESRNPVPPWRDFKEFWTPAFAGVTV